MPGYFVLINNYIYNLVMVNGTKLNYFFNLQSIAEIYFTFLLKP